MRRNKNNGNKVRYFFNSDRNSWRIHQKNKAKRGIMILIGSLLTLAVLPAITHGFVIAPPWANPVINPCSGTSWQLIYWPPDGRCYQIFEKGPCPDTQELAFHAVSKRVSTVQSRFSDIKFLVTLVFELEGAVDFYPKFQYCITPCGDSILLIRLFSRICFELPKLRQIFRSFFDWIK